MLKESGHFEEEAEMYFKQAFVPQLWAVILTVLLAASLMAACSSRSFEATTPTELKTWLLVRSPGNPLPSSTPVTVKSRSEAPEPGVSHVELYLVEFRSPENNELLLSNVLIRSDAAPFDQTVFTAEQVFTPIEPGHYVIKVVGHDKLGNSAGSEFIGFTVK